jgi:hypothetical protein
MSTTLHVDEELLQSLPLPLAQLYRRALNAKTPLERHQATYYLWEAALKLLGSVRLEKLRNTSCTPGCTSFCPLLSASGTFLHRICIITW